MTKIDAPTAKRGRPPKAKAAGTADTRDLILDAAEDLFSKHGFYGVTIREVAREAGVDTALVHYYFGAKRGLFDAVFLRRAEVWNNERVDAINRYAAELGDAMTLEGLFEAFLRPPFQWSMKGGPGWKHYSALVAQTNANPTFGGDKFNNHYTNLRYGTPAENHEDTLKHGKRRIGVTHPLAKLKEKDVRFIRESELSGVELASKFGVSSAHISAVRRNRAWKHI
jgi:AcrR family transcriptional regulator